MFPNLFSTSHEGNVTHTETSPIAPLRLPSSHRVTTGANSRSAFGPPGVSHPRARRSGPAGSGSAPGDAPEAAGLSTQKRTTRPRSFGKGSESCPCLTPLPRDPPWPEEEAAAAAGRPGCAPRGEGASGRGRLAGSVRGTQEGRGRGAGPLPSPGSGSAFPQLPGPARLRSGTASREPGPPRL